MASLIETKGSKFSKSNDGKYYQYLKTQFSTEKYLQVASLIFPAEWECSRRVYILYIVLANRP